MLTLYRYRIQSPFEPIAVLERLRSLARTQPGFAQAIREGFGWRSPGTPPFIGEVRTDGFLLRRDIRYRNSFLPLIRGAVLASPGGSQICLAMQLHPAVLVFMLCWLGFAALVLVQQGCADAAVPAGMFLFGLGLTAAGFCPEAVKARRLLEPALVGAT